MLLGIKQNQQNQLDKSIFVVAGALFNLLLIFINKIVPLETASWICFFNFAIALLGISIGLVMYSYKLSADEACIAYEKVNQGKEYRSEESKSNEKIKALNKWALFFTSVAIASTVVFVTYNLWEKNMKNRVEQNTSYQKTQLNGTKGQIHSIIKSKASG